MKLDSRKGACALRHRAEKKLAKDGRKAETEATYDSTALIHDLRVHQIELEMQNEELRRAQAESDKLHRKFEDLYDFAPIGYLTLDRQGSASLTWPPHPVSGAQETLSITLLSYRSWQSPLSPGSVTS